MDRKSRHTMTMNRKSAKERERKQRKKLLTRCRVIEKICVWKRQLKRERERERERLNPFQIQSTVVQVQRSRSNVFLSLSLLSFNQNFYCSCKRLLRRKRPIQKVISVTRFCQTLSNPSRALIFCQSDEILPNLVTLNVIVDHSV